MEIFEQVKAILVEQFFRDEDAINMDASFVDDLGVESLDFVELLLALEDEFDLIISDEEAEKIHTVGDVVMFIEERQKV
ncbi:Acyl carrier protein [Sporotomaculum syntrophicum]|uniref:Acyl carrier protein n=1 Tax=Sporotomaculum syntrophicum TaxID=182264 RepID=A0A9D2WMY7_9FIRM|nr:acyl carrier protein [Sporotomaculum syntrophicum]KAF1084375.1 Acyl carrier protein [Sporotomaculum syntrophicum]